MTIAAKLTPACFSPFSGLFLSFSCFYVFLLFYAFNSLNLVVAPFNCVVILGYVRKTELKNDKQEKMAAATEVALNWTKIRRIFHKIELIMVGYNVLVTVEHSTLQIYLVSFFFCQMTAMVDLPTPQNVKVKIVFGRKQRHHLHHSLVLPGGLRHHAGPLRLSGPGGRHLVSAAAAHVCPAARQPLQPGALPLCKTPQISSGGKQQLKSGPDGCA